MRSLASKKLSDRFLRSLELLLKDHNRKSHDRTGQVAARTVCSDQTRRDRASFLKLAFAELADMGYRLEKPDSLKEKHIEALAARWNGKGIALRTLHTRLSMLRVFAGWIGKPGMVKDIEHYFPDRDMTRTATATENRAWIAKGVDPDAVIAQALMMDKRFGLMLMLQRHFGMRVKESIEICPLRAVTPDGKELIVVDGTKGGLPRIVPIRTEEQRNVIALVRETVVRGRNKRLRWDGLTFKQAHNRFYALTEKLGITKDGLGVTPHGLRHGYSQQRAHDLTGGLPTPIEGGAIGQIDRETHKKVSQQVSLELGHRRPDVVNFYYGSYKHQLREPMTTERQLKMWGLPT